MSPFSRSVFFTNGNLVCNWTEMIYDVFRVDILRRREPKLLYCVFLSKVESKLKTNLREVVK